MAKGYLCKNEFKISIAILACLLFFSGCTQYIGPVSETEKDIISGDRISKAAEYFRRGIQSQNEDDVIKYLTVAIKLNPEFADAYHVRGCAYASKGNYALGLKDINTAIKIDPQNPDYYVSRAFVNLKKRNLSKAVGDVQKAIEIDGENASAHELLGALLTILNKTEDALRHFDIALGLDPDYFPAYVNRGFLYYKIGEYEKAFEDCNRAIELAPDTPKAYSNRAIIYAVRGEYDRAMADINRALELNPDNPDLYYDRALVFYHLALYRRAVDDFKRYLKREPRGIYMEHLREVLDKCEKNLDTIVVFFFNIRKDPSSVFPVKRKISKTDNLPLKAIEEVIKGPAEDEKQKGFYYIENIKIKSFRIQKQIAYVDLQGDFIPEIPVEKLREGNLDQRILKVCLPIRETLSQFPDIKKTVICVEGKRVW